ncbi:ribonuclease [Rhizobium sp. LjRoot30]
MSGITFRSLVMAWLLIMLGLFSPTAAMAQDDSEAAAAKTQEQATTGRKGRTQLILAASWQPGFCERRRKKPECASQTADRFDASRFSLHGLWKIRKSYCDVSAELQAADKKRDWKDLPAVTLSPDTAASLSQKMPGVQSGLDRHEWVKHGSCSGVDAETYFRTSLLLLEQLNTSAVGKLFGDNIGKPLTEVQIKKAFEDSFGEGAGDRVKMRCNKDGDRRIITELTIGLNGTVSTENASLAAMIAGAGTTKFDCPEGIVDAAGFQ